VGGIGNTRPIRPKTRICGTPKFGIQPKRETIFKARSHLLWAVCAPLKPTFAKRRYEPVRRSALNVDATVLGNDLVRASVWVGNTRPRTKHDWDGWDA
jgi:hypothetical protein